MKEIQDNNNKLKEKDEDILSYFKQIISKYFNIKNDRLDLMSDNNAPELAVDFIFSPEGTQIMFCVGTHSYKHSVPESIFYDYLLDFYEAKKIIDYILNDHDFISNIYINNNKFNLVFKINWSNDALSGIYCRDIEVNFEFYNKNKLRNMYIKKFIMTYMEKLKDTPSFIEMKNEYLNANKITYFDYINKKDMLDLLQNMSEEELRSLLKKIDNDIFIKYVFEDSDSFDFDVKKLS